MRFGTEILFISVLGGLLFGPTQLTTILGHVAQAKAHFENATRKFKSQAESELSRRNCDEQTDSVCEVAENR